MKQALISAVGALVLGIAAPAGAVDLMSTNGSGAVGNCQAALPSFEGNVRKRPLAMINEGASPAFVTCALATEEVSINVNGFSTDVGNLSQAPATVSCTAVVGDEMTQTRYIVKTITLAPGASGRLSWSTSDNGGALFAKSVALSCALPPMVGLNRNRITTLLSLI